MAYQGFGQGLDEDAQGLRYMAERVPEMLLAVSCSKNFGLYRERVGILMCIAATHEQASAVQSHLLSIVRGIYSMPPDHGAAIVAEVMQNVPLERQWRGELADMRARILGLRNDFVQTMAAIGDRDFSFVQRQQGMFSYLGLTEAQVAWLAKNKSIYMLPSSRASIAGLNQVNLSYVCSSISAALAQA